MLLFKDFSHKITMIMIAQVHESDTVRLNLNVRVWSKERFIAGPGKEVGGTSSKIPPAL